MFQHWALSAAVLYESERKDLQHQPDCNQACRIEEHPKKLNILHMFCTQFDHIPFQLIIFFTKVPIYSCFWTTISCAFKTLRWTPPLLSWCLGNSRLIPLGNFSTWKQGVHTAGERALNFIHPYVPTQMDVQIRAVQDKHPGLFREWRQLIRQVVYLRVALIWRLGWIGRLGRTRRYMEGRRHWDPPNTHTCIRWKNVQTQK